MRTNAAGRAGPPEAPGAGFHVRKRPVIESTITYSAFVQLDHDFCYSAIRSRDPRFDGKLFTAVTSTGIYCRPVCPAKTPRKENVRFYAYAAAAEKAGFRPCLRCRPEVAPWTSAWSGTSATVARALRLIGEGALDDGDVDALAQRLGVTSRQVRRLFVDEVGVPPVAVAQARRVHFARTLLVDTALPITDVAFAAGFASVRRFNAAVLDAYGIAPRDMRRGRALSTNDDEIVVRLTYRPPYDWRGILAFLGPRAIRGVERVTEDEYRRTIDIDGVQGMLRVRCDEAANVLLVTIPRAFTSSLKTIVDRVRRQFDLFADPQTIAEQLGADPLLAPLVPRWPGLRVPGAWEPFELSIRAVVGQQVTVAGATTIVSRIAAKYGQPIVTSDPDLNLIFPAPARLARARISGMPASRAATLRALGASGGAIDGVKGIGPWTANYIGMRSGDPDAFPIGDVALRRASGLNDRELANRAEAWRPWRAYAAMLLWRSL